MNLRLFACTCLLIISALACKPNYSQEHVANYTQQASIHAYLNELMATHQIPGAAVAVIHHGAVLHEGYYGLASLEFEVPVSEKHMFRVYSTTKLLVATAIFQLQEKGLLNINDPLAKHLSNLAPTWKDITIKHLLTHTSGLPDFIRFESQMPNDAMWEKLSSTPMEFETGTQWRYNQTNYWLLALIIEKLSNQSLHDFIAIQQFEGNPKGLLLSSDSREVLPNRISKYNFDHSQGHYSRSIDKEQSRGLAGNGLNISLKKFITWAQKLENDELLSPQSKAEMWSSHGMAAVRRAFLMGWGNYSYDNVKSYGFTGGGVSAFRHFPNEELTIIFLSSGFESTSVNGYVIIEIAGLVNPDLLRPTIAQEAKLMNDFIGKPLSEVLNAFEADKKQNPGAQYEGILNRIGYMFLSTRQTEKAIKVFALNTQEYPSSANTFDSLGEAYWIAGDVEKALENYKKVLELDPENTNASRMIAMIKKST